MGRCVLIPRWFAGLDEPVEVRLAGGFGSEDEEFRDLVGVELTEGGFEGFEVGGGGLNEEQSFGGGLDFALPAIDGGEAGDDADAGGEPLVDESAGDALSFFAGAGSGQDQASFGGGYNHRCVWSELPGRWQHHNGKRTREKHGGRD